MRVYFMTNRNQRDAMPYPQFGFERTDDVSVGFADMDGPVPNEAAMAPDAVKLTVSGVANTVSADIMDGIAQSDGSHLLLYIHGFNYTFREAMIRTGWLTGWLGAATTTPVAGPALCFSFPSQGSMLSFERDRAGMFASFGLTYSSDYQRATDSGPAAARALGMMAEIATRFRQTRQPAHVTLLAHSMGNHVLAAALGAANAAHALPQKSAFDRIILMASDETQDSVRPGGLLAHAGAIADKVYVYHDAGDIPLSFSGDKVHRDTRLGQAGPPRNKAPNRLYDVPDNFQVINCSQVAPVEQHAIIDWQHHQYYRLYPWVRDDIALVMNCGTTDDVNDFPRRRRSAQDPNLIRLESPEMQAISLTHPVFPLSTRD